MVNLVALTKGILIKEKLCAITSGTVFKQKVISQQTFSFLFEFFKLFFKAKPLTVPTFSLFNLLY